MSDSTTQRRRIVRREQKQDPTTSYTMPKRLRKCYRCETKPKYTVSTMKYDGATPNHKYYCPECGQGAKYDLHTDEGQAHAALIWNDTQCKGAQAQTELEVLEKGLIRLQERRVAKDAKEKVSRN